MAAYPKVEGAIERGYLEVVERSGMRALWKSPLASVIEAADFPDAAATWASFIERAGFRVSAALVEHAGAWCAAVFAINGGVVVTSGAGWSAASAIEHAAIESYGQVVQAVRVAGTMRAPEVLRTPIDHFLYYLEPRGMLEDWGYFRAPRVKAPPGELEPELSGYVIDRGNSLADYLGLSIVHVVVPEMTPLRLDEPGPWPTPFG